MPLSWVIHEDRDSPGPAREGSDHGPDIGVYALRRSILRANPGYWPPFLPPKAHPHEVAIGVSIVGGCWGTTPATIDAVARRLCKECNP